jgi:two-component system, OmpR family, sensor histidine kinase KdpD
MDWKRLHLIGRGYPFALLATVAAVAVLLPLRAVLPASTIMLAFVPVIIVVARLAGARPSGVAAVAAFLLLDFVFTPPYYRLTVAQPSAWVGLLVFLLVALVSGGQTARLRQREQAAVARQRELELLNRMSFRVASEESAEGIARFVVGHLVTTLGAGRAALFLVIDGAPQLVAASGREGAPADEEVLVAWVLAEGKAIALPQADLPADQRFVSVAADEAVPGIVASGVYLPLQTADWFEGVLFALPGHDGPPSADEARLLAALANLSASCLERQRLEAAASRAEALHEADRLKTTLVSSVSHELKTPLAAATARVTGLLDEEAPRDLQRLDDELAATATDLERLNASIGSLLDLSRLEAASWEPRLERFEVSEILGTVLERLPVAQRGRVRFDISEPVPDVLVDFTQLARALTNVVENALAYSPREEPVLVTARHAPAAGEVAIAVEDRGPGIEGEEKRRVFEKFYRGSASASVPGGSGLGLAIASEIVRTHHGTLRVEDASPTGARFVLTLPSEPREGVA